MTIKNSGSPLSFSEIASEFGYPTGKKLGNYRVTQSLKRNGNTFRQLTLDGETPGTPGSIPTSGQIKFSDFYGKRLTNVIDIFSGGQENLLNAKKIFNVIPNRVTVVGPKNSQDRREANSKVIISVNKTVGSEKGDQTKCALRTGSWDSTVQLQVIVDNQGRINGAGGNGGDGSDGLSGAGGNTARGFNGSVGTSGLGIEYGNLTNVTKIFNGGIISAGFGGGGGGAGGQETSKNDRRAGGGGGGGGAGIPAGIGGKGGAPQAGTRDNPSDIGKDGGDGSKDAFGTGKAGGDNDDQAGGGRGGNGAKFGTSAQNGFNSQLNDGTTTFGGAAGSNGAAIRKSNSSIIFEIPSEGFGIRGATDATIISQST